MRMDYETGGRGSTVVDWLSAVLWIVLALGLLWLFLSSSTPNSWHALSLPLLPRLRRITRRSKAWTCRSRPRRLSKDRTMKLGEQARWAILAGVSVLAHSEEVTLDEVERILV